MRSSERSDAIAFCERVRPRLVGMLSLYCGDPAVAEEHAHEAIIRVWENWDAVKAMSSPEAWTLRVALNGVTSVFRRRLAERRALVKIAGRQAEPHTNNGVDEVDVRKAVAALPRRQKMVVVLRYYLDMSIEDTASFMGCAPGTVKSLTSKALAALRELPILHDQETAR
jgi:RNA polymerase sigma factor (sigma-70 family)